MRKTRKTIVVNLKYKEYTVYIGRGTKFGNKYLLGYDGLREDVIAKHKKDFENNPELQEAVWNELRGEILGCFCKPLACHGDTYIEYIENRERKKMKQVKEAYNECKTKMPHRPPDEIDFGLGFRAGLR